MVFFLKNLIPNQDHLPNPPEPTTNQDCDSGFEEFVLRDRYKWQKALAVVVFLVIISLIIHTLLNGDTLASDTLLTRAVSVWFLINFEIGLYVVYRSTVNFERDISPLSSFGDHLSDPLGILSLANMLSFGIVTLAEFFLALVLVISAWLITLPFYFLLPLFIPDKLGHSIAIIIGVLTILFLVLYYVITDINFKRWQLQRKYYRKIWKLHRIPLTTIIIDDDLIITADNQGKIHYWDKGALGYLNSYRVSPVSIEGLVVSFPDHLFIRTEKLVTHFIDYHDKPRFCHWYPKYNELMLDDSESNLRVNAGTSWFVPKLTKLNSYSRPQQMELLVKYSNLEQIVLTPTYLYQLINKHHINYNYEDDPDRTYIDGEFEEEETCTELSVRVYQLPKGNVVSDFSKMYDGHASAEFSVNQSIIWLLVKVNPQFSDSYEQLIRIELRLEKGTFDSDEIEIPTEWSKNIRIESSRGSTLLIKTSHYYDLIREVKVFGPENPQPIAEYFLEESKKIRNLTYLQHSKLLLGQHGQKLITINTGGEITELMASVTIFSIIDTIDSGVSRLLVVTYHKDQLRVNRVHLFQYIEDELTVVAHSDPLYFTRFEKLSIKDEIVYFIAEDHTLHQIALSSLHSGPLTDYSSM